MAFILDSKNKNKNIVAYQKSIKEKNESINRYYDEIGRLYYGQYLDLNVDNTKDINTRCEAITRLNGEIEQLNHKILFEKGLKLCPNCRTENNLEYTFCFKCGGKFEENQPEVAPAAVETPVVPAPVEETPVEPVSETEPAVEEAPASEPVTEETAQISDEDIDINDADAEFHVNSIPTTPISEE